MAHGNHHCCAICDRKMAYSQNAKAKKSICSKCAIKLTKLDVPADSVSAFKEWARGASNLIFIGTLFAVKYKPCGYPNDFDYWIGDRLGMENIKELRDYFGRLYETAQGK